MAKAAPKLGAFISKNADDAPKVVEAISQVSKQLSKDDEVLAALIKALPNSSVDNIIKAIQKGNGISYNDFKKLTKALDEAGESIPNLIDGIKFKNFRALKKALKLNSGQPLPSDWQWHHLVEQCQVKSTRSGFSVCDINTTANMRATPKTVHEKISRYYSSAHGFTGGKSFRDWLNGQSFDKQLEEGLRVWKEKMIEAGYSI